MVAVLRLGSPAFAATQVVFLGTGTPQPDADRSGPATAIVVNGSAYLDLPDLRQHDLEHATPMMERLALS